MRHFTRIAAAGLIAAAACLPLRASAEAPVTSFKLDNGMQVVVIEDHRAPVVTHMVWYRVGAADDPAGHSGIAHFFEHLMFKGTDEIPEGAFSKIVAENGGQDNAFTSWDYTAYFQRIAKDRLGLVMHMEADRMRDLVLNEQVVSTERDVILEERNSRTDNDPGSLFNEQLRGTLYLNSPYRRPVIGWRQEIERLSLKDARAFYDRYYAPDNAILVVAGDVTPEEVKTLAQKNYGPLSPSGDPADLRPQEPPHLAAQRIVMKDGRVRQPYVVRNYLVPPYESADPKEAAALTVLSDVLGDGITSRFAQKLELGDKIAVATGAGYSPVARDTTTFSVYGVPAPGHTLAEVEKALDGEIADIIATGPTQEEVDRVKQNLKASLIYAQDSQSSQAQRYGAALAVGQTVEDVQSWPDQIQAVTPADVQAAAEKWLKPESSATGYLEGTTGEAG